MTRRIPGIGLVTTVASLSSGNELAVGDDLPQFRGEHLSARKAPLPKDAYQRVLLMPSGFTYETADRGNVSTVDGYTERWKQQLFEKARCKALAAQVRKLVSGQ